MPLILQPMKRYDMPASFGYSTVPDFTEVKRAESLVLSCKTSVEVAAALVPLHFTVPDQPVLTVAHMNYQNVDYMGGRSYNEIVVSLSASYSSAGERIDAALALVLWVDQPGALIAGREFMGLPKILGRISDLAEIGPDLCFSCGEYDSTFIEGKALSLSPIDAVRLAKVNDRARDVRTFGWKYIAAPGGGVDLDYPLVNAMRWSYEKAWAGEGHFRFIETPFADAPMSAAVIASLANLPLEGPIRAFRGIGSAIIDRRVTRRLGPS